LEYKDWVKLDARYEELALQPRRPTREMVDYAKKIQARPPGSKQLWHSAEVLYAKRVLLADQAPEQLRVPIQAFRIGDLGLAATPVETLVEIGLELKEKTPFAKTFVIEIANGYFGYMPTVEQHKLGGYEAWVGSNRLEIEAAPKMVTGLLKMLREM